MQDFEMVVMELITNAGEAKSLAIQAIRSARKKNFAEAEKLIQECDQFMVKAHNGQTNLIQEELNGIATPMSLLMVHAQDHVMNAVTIRDLAVEMIEMMKED